jgi:4-hydroxy-tetrahydrodipicolinate synthase
VFQKSQEAEADSLQLEVERQGRALRKYPVIPGLKAILAESRKDPGWENIRPPLVELSAAQRQGLFDDFGN